MRLLLIVSGGIAAYKSLDFVRLARKAGFSLRSVLTQGGAQFVTPLSLSALSEQPVYSDLFSLTEESEMGHIRLSRESDLIVIAPASADLIGKMALGLADDLASTVLLASDKPILMAPAMNHRMWENAAVQSHIRTLRERGIRIVGPMEGDMACGEYGMGRMAEPADILSACQQFFKNRRQLEGLRALVTSGPTREAIDPIRYIANRSSGKQGHAIASALAEAGAETILISGPSQEADPAFCRTIHVESAEDMLAACLENLPVDIAVCAAAVADWKVAQPQGQKIKKDNNAPPKLDLLPNSDILARLSSKGKSRPKLVIGFAAETQDLLANAQKKRAQKGCDWMLANAIGASSPVFGAEQNKVTFLQPHSVEEWPEMPKAEIACRLVERIARHFSRENS